MAAGLPNQVILYIKSRSNDKRFILMDTSFSEDTLAWTLTPSTVVEQLNVLAAPPVTSIGEYLGQYTVHTTTGVLLRKAIRKHMDIRIASASGLEALVISLSGHTTIFGSHTLKHNLSLTHTYLASTPAPAPVVVTKKSDQLCHFVAKKLMRLAILDKEQCPITVEDFSEGNTAVMPCGHLFMQSAIEESFKMEPTKCPWCRQPGRPQYV
uniref:RING-type domain-containing protein n=1 Tax=viral metagenome TaxID=1070528 RepID=A0A6C0E6H3_9ZZZZ